MNFAHALHLISFYFKEYTLLASLQSDLNGRSDLAMTCDIICTPRVKLVWDQVGFMSANMHSSMGQF